MQVKLDGNGFSFEVKWASVKALLKALQPVITGICTFMTLPAVAQFGHHFGWW